MRHGPIDRQQMRPAVMRSAGISCTLMSAMLMLYVCTFRASPSGFLRGSCFTLGQMERMLDLPAPPDSVDDIQREDSSRELLNLDVPGVGYRAVLVGIFTLVPLS